MKNARHPKKIIKRETLQSWISYKNQQPYFQYLSLFTKVIRAIFKQEKTLNPHKNLTKDIENKMDLSKHKLFSELIHSLTLLNHLYRVFTVNGYESTKEDVLSAAALLQLEINPESLLYLKTKLIFWQIQETFTDKEFSIRDIMHLLDLTKPTASRHIRALENTGYISHVRTGSRNRYYYVIN